MIKKHHLIAVYILLATVACAQRQTFERINVTDLGKFQKSILLRNRFADSISIDTNFYSVTDRTLPSALAVKKFIDKRIAGINVNTIDTTGKWIGLNWLSSLMKYSDSASMLSPYLRSTTAAANYVPQLLTQNTSVDVGISNQLSFVKGASNYMTIQNDGEIKINRTSDLISSGLFKLNVNGYVGIQNTASSSDFSLIGLYADNPLSSFMHVRVRNSATLSTNWGIGLGPYTTEIIKGGTNGNMVIGTAGNQFVFLGTSSLVRYGIDGAGQHMWFINGGTAEAMKLTIAGNLLIGSTTDNASSILTMHSTSKGFLPPRHLLSQRTSIISPAIGLQAYQTDGTEGYYQYTSTGWRRFAFADEITNLPHTHSIADVTSLQTTLDGKEGLITSGTTSQYWRGDKTWQTLDKAAVGLPNVENTALSTWSGSSNITTVGTISTGTWNGNTIAINKGGTSNPSLSVSTGSIYYGDGTKLVALAPGTANQILQCNGAAAPTWVDKPTVGTNTLAAVVLSSAFSSTVVTEATVTGWSFAVTAGKSYRVEIIATYQTAATTTGGELGFYLSGGATGTVVGNAEADIVSTAAATGLKQPITAIGAADLAGSNLISTGVTAINSPHGFHATIVFTCTTSGTFNVGWASEVAGSAAQLNAGSTLTYQQLN